MTNSIYVWATCGHDFRFPLPLTAPIPNNINCAPCGRTVGGWAQSDQPKR